VASGPDQDFVRRLEEQLRQLKVADVLAQMVVTITQLAWQRLAAEARDLGEARLAIDALCALVPVLKDAVAPELARDLAQAVSNLQLAYAGAASESAGGAAPAGGADAGGAESRTHDEPLPGDEPPAEPVHES
jgi:hypothetical protein